MTDWQVGDLAVCVDDLSNERSTYPWDPKLGGVYRVSGVTVSSAYGIILDLAEDPFANEVDGWEEKMFRKIRPADDEFTQLLRQCKPAKVQA